MASTIVLDGSPTSVTLEVNSQTLVLSTVAVAGSAATSQLGTPTDGDFSDGYVSLSPATMVSDAIDALNEGLAAVRLAAEGKLLGAPADGSWADGLVALTAATPLADAIDALNEGALAVQGAGAGAQTAATAAGTAAASAQAAAGAAQASAGTAQTTADDAGLAAGAARLVADSAQSAASTAQSTASAAQTAAAAAQATANAPGQRGAGTPSDGGWGGYVSLADTTKIVDALDALNTGLATVNTLAYSAQSTALAAAQQQIGTPTDGSWTDGLVAGLTGTTKIADALDALNAGALGIVNGTRTFTGLTVSGDVSIGGVLSLPTIGRVAMGGADVTDAATDSAILLGPLDPSTYATGVGVPHGFGYNGIAIGKGALINATGDNNLVLGSMAAAFYKTGAPVSNGCFRNTVIGAQYAGAQGYRNVSIGNGATCSGSMNLSVGDYATVGTGAFGGQPLTYSTIDVQNATALGKSASIQHSYSTALGAGATTTATHQVMLGTAAETVVHPGLTSLLGALTGTTATLSGLLTSASLSLGAAGSVQWGALTKLLAPADGTLQITKADGTFGTLLLGGAGLTTGVRLTASSGVLSLTPGSGLTDAVRLDINVQTGQTALNTAGEIKVGEIAINRAAGDAMHFSPLVNLRLASDSQMGWASGSGLSTARDTTMYRDSAGVVGINAGASNTATGALKLATLIYGAGTRSLAPADGTLQVTKADGTVSTLLLGQATANGGMLLIGGNRSLTLVAGDGVTTAQLNTNSIVAGVPNTAGVYVGAGNSPGLFGGGGNGAQGAVVFPTANTGAVSFQKATGTLTGPAFTFDGQVSLPSGTAAAPSALWADVGLYRQGAGLLGFSLNGVSGMQVGVGSANVVRFTNLMLDSYAAGFEFYCGRFGGNASGRIDSSGGLVSWAGISSSTSTNGAQGANASPFGGIQWQGADVNAAKAVLSGTAQLSAVLSGASVSLAAAIPAGSIVLGVATRVTTAITGATSYSVGDGTNAIAFGSALSPALNTTSTTANWTIATAPVYAAAANIVLTANGGSFTAGRVRVNVFYVTCAAAAS